MLPALILQTDKRKNNERKSVAASEVESFRSTPEPPRVLFDTSLNDAEDRRIAIIMLSLFIFMLLPGFAMMIYLIFNPDAFTYDVAP